MTVKLTTTGRERLAVHIRLMLRPDLPQVLSIEQASFEFPWCEEEFLRVLRKRNCIGMIAEPARGADEKKTVCGFVIYEMIQNRFYVHDLAIGPGYRRRGVGRALLAGLVGRLSPPRRTRFETFVREGDVGAHLFLRSCGLWAIEVIRGHYKDTGEDAYRFVYRFRGTGGVVAP